MEETKYFSHKLNPNQKASIFYVNKKEAVDIRYIVWTVRLPDPFYIVVFIEVKADCISPLQFTGDYHP